MRLNLLASRILGIFAKMSCGEIDVFLHLQVIFSVMRDALGKRLLGAQLRRPSPATKIKLLRFIVIQYLRGH